MGIIRKYTSLDFKKKTEYSTIISIVFNICSGIFQFILGIITREYFLCLSGFVNFFLLTSKLNCIFGIRNVKNKSFKERNLLVSLMLILSGICYILYMARLLIFDIQIKQYNMYIAIIIAAISFTQIGLAINGLVKAKGHGHLYKDIKVINFTSSLTGIVLTQTALLSMKNSEVLNTSVGYFGIGVGFIAILLGVFLLISPKYSIYEREHQVFKNRNTCNNKEIKIMLIKDKIVGSYYYHGEISDNICDGYIKKERMCFFRMNIFFKILVCILSEILIFVLAFDALVFYFRSFALFKKLNKRMEALGFENITNI